MAPKIPTSIKDISKEWVEEVISLNFKDAKSIAVTYLEEPKDFGGFLSNAMHACVKISCQDGSEEEFKVFIKLMPEDEMFQALVADSASDMTEIEAYKSFFTTMEYFELEQTGASKIKALSPKFFAGDYGEATVTVKDDNVRFFIDFFYTVCSILLLLLLAGPSH